MGEWSRAGKRRVGGSQSPDCKHVYRTSRATALLSSTKSPCHTLERRISCRIPGACIRLSKGQVLAPESHSIAAGRRSIPRFFDLEFLNAAVQALEMFEQK